MNIVQKIKISISTLFLFFFMSSALALAAPQTTCPVMGGGINKELYADHNGERVYFCCMGCEPQFVKDPAKYLEKMKAAGEEPEKIETTKQEA